MIQEHTYGVYQPGTPSPDLKILMIQPSLDISYSPFSSSEILTLELILPPSGYPMNITILDYLVFSIPYISQVPSTYPISDQFPMDTCRNIYVVAIYSEDPSMSTTDVQLL